MPTRLYNVKQLNNHIDGKDLILAIIVYKLNTKHCNQPNYITLQLYVFNITFLF